MRVLLVHVNTLASAETCVPKGLCAFVCMLFVSARQRDGAWHRGARGIRLCVSGWVLGTLKQTFLSRTLPEVLEVNHS